MEKFKRVLRLLGLAILLAFALSGLGMIVIPAAREKYQDKEIRIELVEKREDEHEEISDDAILPM